MIFINKKSGEVYIVLRSDVLNATNDVNGQRMVLYAPVLEVGIVGAVYVREYNEFHEKFKVKE